MSGNWRRKLGEIKWLYKWIGKRWTYISGTWMFPIKHSNNTLKIAIKQTFQSIVGLLLTEIILKVEPTKKTLKEKPSQANCFFFLIFFFLWQWPRILIIMVRFHLVCIRGMHGVQDVFHLLWTFITDFVSHHMVSYGRCNGAQFLIAS